MAELVLVGLDGADWRVITPLLDAGRLPHFSHIVDGGLVGDLHTVAPTASPSVWTTVATGLRPLRHGVHGHFEPVGDRGVRPVTSATSLAPPFWQVLSDAGLSCAVIDWPAARAALLPHGCVITEGFRRLPEAEPHSVYPPRLESALSTLRLQPEELGREVLGAFVPGLKDAVESRDLQLAELAVYLAQLASVHAAATCVLEREAPAVLAVRYGPFERLSRAFMPYHPPQTMRVADRDFALYSNVIEAAYELADAMLGRLLALAGSDATVMVMSAHGMHSDWRRPSVTAEARHPSRWHRRFGIFCAIGPSVAVDERVYGLSVLDIAPTVLSVLGVAPPSAMEGRPCSMVAATPTQRLYTPDGAAAASADAIEADAGSAVTVPEEGQATADAARREWLVNKASAFMEAAQFGEAADVLTGLAKAAPDDLELVALLARAELALGRIESCRAPIASLLTAHPATPAARLLAAAVAIHDRCEEDAAAHLRAAEDAAGDDSYVLAQVGAGFAQLSRHHDAERALELGRSIDPDSPTILDGLAALYLQMGRPVEAADAALEAIARDSQCASAHFHLGLAMAGAGWRQRAIRAFETYESLRPESMTVRRLLARLRTTLDTPGAVDAAITNGESFARSAGGNRRDMRSS